MAKLCPTLAPHTATRAGDYAELYLLQTLERGLSDAYTLFHSVDWSRGTAEKEQHGEIDVVAVNQAGDVLLIEVKAGHVDFFPEGMFKTYGSHTKNVKAQVGLQFGALRTRLIDAGLHVRLHHLLVLPAMKVQTETAQWPRERIVDSQDMTNIVSRVTQLMGPGLHNADLQVKVLSFFEDRFRVEPDVSALAGNLQRTVTRLSAGLALCGCRALRHPLAYCGLSELLARARHNWHFVCCAMQMWLGNALPIFATTARWQTTYHE